MRSCNPLARAVTDKIHFHHVEHTGAHIARQAARLQHHQRQHRQRQVGSHLQHILPAALVAAGIGHPAYRQPVEIDGEPFNQQQAEEKGGERHGGKHRDAHQMIKPGAGSQGRNHADRQADAPVKDQRDAGQQKRVPDVLVEQLADRDLILQRKSLNHRAATVPASGGSGSIAAGRGRRSPSAPRRGQRSG